MVKRGEYLDGANECLGRAPFDDVFVSICRANQLINEQTSVLLRVFVCVCVCVCVCAEVLSTILHITSLPLLPSVSPCF